ncbi:Protein of unknown function D [Prunus dulcis]|uniref:cysteine dioxygenase n=1 Tax=Prunus dulcis TaxID=3755 RepID=A0A4Y1RRM3_PRUDU|nr:Protein of unknown function D [Prunus dulcis]
MTMETARLVEQGRDHKVVSRVGHASKVGYHVSKAITKRKCGKKIKHSVPSTVLQQLFVSCRQVFKGPGTVPSPHDATYERKVKAWTPIYGFGGPRVPSFELPKGNGFSCLLLLEASVSVCFLRLNGNLLAVLYVLVIAILAWLVLDLKNSNKMRPEDVGLSRDLQFFKPKTVVQGTPRVTYTTIYECSNFSLCCLFIPATGVIPLHNHPEMTVFSKLLLGKMHIKSYDLVDPVNSDGSTPAPQLRLAKLKADSVFTSPCNTSVLYPTEGGNIHAFTAITPCAVLDVLGPPYSKEDDRDCSYYKDHPYAAYSNGEASVTEGNGDCYGWLEEIEMPENSEMDKIPYLGPQVTETSC